MKIGRNAPCPCGSGKKYKACCLNKASASPKQNISNITNINLHRAQKFAKEKPPLLMTRTDEIYQPVRIHYQVYDKDEVLKAFSKLHCMEFDQGKNRWAWLFDEEARQIKLNKTYREVPEEYRPIVIGYLYFREEDKMHMDVRSIQRAIAAIPFFDKYISRTAAKARYLDIMNRLFGAEDGFVDNFDVYFDREDIRPPIDPDKLIEEIKAIQSRTDDVNEKKALAVSYLDNQFQEPYTGAERLPVHFYEEGISHLTTVLQIRQSVAIKHWLGETDYTIRDFINYLIQHSSNQEPE